MHYNSHNYRRRNSLRLKGYDYSQAGYYFVTAQTKNKKYLFGKIEKGEMLLNQAGKIVQSAWDDLPNHYKNIELDEFIIMPNHVHGIIIINPVSPKDDYKHHGLSEFIRAFKTFSSRRINEWRKTHGVSV